MAEHRKQIFAALLVLLILCAGFYLLGQAGLFFTLRRADASRVSPLLGLKVAVVAVLTVAALGGTIAPVQWAAVCVSVAAAVVLGSVGGRMGLSAFAGIAFACFAYAVSDIHIVQSQQALGDLLGEASDAMQTFYTAVVTMCLCYVLCGIAALAAMPWLGAGGWKDLRYAAPFAASWYGAMICLFSCFGLSAAVFGEGGVAFGGILQSLRGPISVVLGAVVAHLGHVHLEGKLSRGVLTRRVAAALLMVLAVALYALGRQG